MTTRLVVAPAGTANTWKGNKGNTQNRPGLCKNAEVTPPVFTP